MKYSILFLNYDPEHKLCETIKTCLHSVVSNSTGHDYEIIVLDRKGVHEEINRGFRQARGEYLVILSNDVVIKNNWLDHLGVPDTITSWRASVASFDKKYPWNELDCSLVCIPRSVQEKVGFWDTNFAGGYGYDDNDYLYRASKLGIPMKQVPVEIEHKTSMTYNAYNLRHQAGMDKNKAYLYKKHNL